MKLVLDPFMHHHLSLEGLPHKVKELGFDCMELSPCSDFQDWFKAPRVFPERIRILKHAVKDADVGIASLLPVSAGPRTARRNGWRRFGTGSAPSRSAPSLRAS